MRETVNIFEHLTFLTLSKSFFFLFLRKNKNEKTYVLRRLGSILVPVEITSKNFFYKEIRPNIKLVLLLTVINYSRIK